MHVPFGWVALVVGILGAVVYVVQRVRGLDAEFSLLAASVAAFVAGWISCISLPRLQRRLDDVERKVGPTQDARDSIPGP